MDLADFFSTDYHAARDRFRRLAAAHNATQNALSIGAGDLTIDCASFGEPGASRIILVTSGLHGVEGFFGSAVQLACLDALPMNWRIPSNTAFIHLHALCPYGFLHIRRGNENNVDLNRNFLPSGEEYRGCPVLYADLDILLNPRKPPGRDLFGLRLLLARSRYGERNLRNAIAAGQFAYPQGLFFGGHEPSATMNGLLSYLPRWLDPAEKILHLDFHTGLGIYAGHKLLTACPSTSDSVDRLRRIFGDAVEPLDEGTTAYHCRGNIDLWLAQRWAGREVDSVCAEFGTYSPLHVLSAVRAENQAHFWSADLTVKARAKRRLIEAFVPTDPIWRRAVVRQGVGLIRHALGSLR